MRYELKSGKWWNLQLYLYHPLFIAIVGYCLLLTPIELAQVRPHPPSFHALVDTDTDTDTKLKITKNNEKNNCRVVLHVILW